MLFVRCPPQPPGGEKFGCLAQSCSSVDLHCPCPLGELEPLHKVEGSRSRFIMCGAVQLRAVWIVSLELFVHSERIRHVTQGACIYIFVLHSCAILLLLKYIINENELFAEQKIYT